MVKAQELVIEKARKLPSDRQEYLASVIDEIIADNGAIYEMSDEEIALVDAGLADLDAGRIVSDADMAAFWNRNKS